MLYVVKVSLMPSCSHRAPPSYDCVPILLRTVKLIDFGLATRFLPNDEYEEIVGTAHYMAPEMMLNGQWTRYPGSHGLPAQPYIGVASSRPIGGGIWPTLRWLLAGICCSTSHSITLDIRRVVGASGYESQFGCGRVTIGHASWPNLDLIICSQRCALQES